MVLIPSNSLESYRAVLDYLADCGATQSPQQPPGTLKFLEDHKSLHRLYESMSAVAAATPGTSEEEWNPLSQRPHAPLPPSVSVDDLGSEVIILKEAVEAFTTLSHEMMHVALWEPFFTGQWRPQSRRDFVAFSLMAEGFCFFYTDILISSTVRVRLPDGEFALERQSPGNVRFHPVRAFEAVGIREPAEILDIYLEGFAGKTTKLWQPRGGSAYAASLAAQAFHFYQGSLGYLADMHRALGAWGGLSEFYQRFCQIPKLPSLWDEDLEMYPHPHPVRTEDVKAYFEGFFSRGLKALEQRSEAELLRVRWRRMLQMRAYYGLQIRWLLEEGLWVGLNAGKGKSTQTKDLYKIKSYVATYLEDLRSLLVQLARDPHTSPLPALSVLDARYERQVRSFFRKQDLWVGHRWLIAPKRAGGLISMAGSTTSGAKAGGQSTAKTIHYLLEELTLALGSCRSKTVRTEIFGSIHRLSLLGSVMSRKGGKEVDLKAEKSLRRVLAEPSVLPLWSVPLASFDPLHNRYRELVFSYQ